MAPLFREHSASVSILLCALRSSSRLCVKSFFGCALFHAKAQSITEVAKKNLKLRRYQHHFDRDLVVFFFFGVVLLVVVGLLLVNVVVAGLMLVDAAMGLMLVDAFAGA
jgi:hypothetical protein